MARRLKAQRFHADGFNRVCVQGRHAPEESCPIVSENAAVPSVAFDQEGYEALGPGEHHEFFIGMLVEGLEKCARHHEIPLSAIKAAIEDFRRVGYRNEWIHKKKRLRAVGLEASLLCTLDTEKFVLRLRLEKKGRFLFEEPILETKPDETIFAYRFKDVVLDGGKVKVNDRFGRPTFSLDLSTLRSDDG